MVFSVLVYRIGGFFLTLWVASVVIFFTLNFLPGDPASVLLGVQADLDSLERLRFELGLDRPALVRYGEWIFGIFRGEWGTSLIYDRPVAEIIAERAPVSFVLAFFAMSLTLSVALFFGMVSALFPYRRIDSVLMFFNQLVIAIPGFWLGILLIMFFSVHLGWFPAGGFRGWEERNVLKDLALPAIALALPQAAILMRIIRVSMIEMLGKPFLLLAQAKGLGRARAFFTHALRNGFAPILGLCAIQFSFLLVGAIVIETVFSIPGIGRLTFLAVMQRDWTTLQSLILLFVVVVLAIHFLADLLHYWIDPRLYSTRSGGRNASF